MGTGRRQKYMVCLKFFFHPTAAFLGKLAVSADFFIFYRLLHILQFFSGKRWDIKIDHDMFTPLLFFLLFRAPAARYDK